MTSKKKTASQIICENFKLARPQTIFQDYKCTLKASLPFFGRLYIGENHFLFISNMFGYVKECVIDIEKVKKVQQHANNTVTIIEQLKQGNEIIKNQYTFGSFKNNNALKLMQALWKRQKIAGDILKAQQQQVLNVSGTEKMQRLLIDQGKVQANFFNYQTVETQKQKMVEVQLPCSIQQYYQFFLADGAKVYSRKKHLQFKGGQNVLVSEWRKNQQLNSQVRQITANIKVSGVPFKSQAPLSQVWMMKKPNQKQIYINVVTQLAQLPYASYFNCQEHIIVKGVQNQPNRCILSAQVALIFNKSTYMKNTILTRTFADMKDDYNIWVNNVKQILANMAKKAKAAQQQNDVGKKKNKKSIEFEKAQSDKYEDTILNKLDSSLSQIGTQAHEFNGQISKKMMQKINKLTWMVYILLVLNTTIIMHLFLKN